MLSQEPLGGDSFCLVVYFGKQIYISRIEVVKLGRDHVVPIRQANG